MRSDPTPLRHALAALLLVACALTRPAIAADPDPDPEASAIWQRVRQSLFQGRPIETDAGAVVALDTPVRAEDASTVPISIHTRFAQTSSRYVKQVYLLIDQNPSPIAAVFRFTPDSGRADIETRVRIERYTHMRAIAETNDGKLYMTTRWVKAAGGCSAPGGKDDTAALANVGRMKMRIDGPVALGKPVHAQLMISHPNSSGLVMDQVSMLYRPPYFVRKVTVSYAGRVVLEADVDFSISENPNFRFFFVPEGDGDLQAQVVDSKDLSFQERLQIRPSRDAS